MFSNAVTSAVGRLYASASSEAPRLQQVQRVEPVARVAPGAAGVPADHDPPDQTQRHALTDGVRAVFESTVGNDVDQTLSHAGDAARPAAEEHDSAVASEAPTDPILEEAILRFIHAVLGKVAEADGAVSPTDAVFLPGGAGYVEQRDPQVQLPAVSVSRERLGQRIGSLAERLARAGADTDPLDAGGARDGELGKSFTAVLDALGGHAESTSAATPTRGDLVNLMNRLAHAMEGSPPLDNGLPTVGGLLHARA